MDNKLLFLLAIVIAGCHSSHKAEGDYFLYNTELLVNPDSSFLMQVNGGMGGMTAKGTWYVNSDSLILNSKTNPPEIRIESIGPSVSSEMNRIEIEDFEHLISQFHLYVQDSLKTIELDNKSFREDNQKFRLMLVSRQYIHSYPIYTEWFSLENGSSPSRIKLILLYEHVNNVYFQDHVLLITRKGLLDKEYNFLFKKVHVKK